MKRLEVRVGLFVLVGLVLLAALLLQFSKGVSYFRPTYRIFLAAQDAGGLRERAAVQMSGVQIGKVAAIELAPEGRGVTITLLIYQDFRIQKGARFVLEQSGFLGDQYVAIEPATSPSEPFKDGDKAETEAPFNLQQAARSASGLVQRLDDTAKGLNAAIADIHKLLLNQETLTNMAMTIANLRGVTEQAIATVDRVDRLVASNSPAIAQSGSNLVIFSERLNLAGEKINTLVDANGPEVTRAIENLESSTQTLNQLMREIEAGKGLAGALVKNEQMARDMESVTRNLSITTSNLNRLGLWGILWKRKAPKEERASTAPERLAAPKQTHP